MENKETKKAPKKKATTEALVIEKKAKVSNSPINEVVVTAKKFGTYKKGDVIQMNDSTARACIKSGVVEAK
jgi:hypothetical protein